MEFRTEIEIGKATFNINHKSKIMFLGSCFTENIGNILEKYKFNLDINPFGILYNPLSVKKSLEILMNKQIFEEGDLVKKEGIWHSFSHHSRFSGLDKNQVLENINERINNSSEFLHKADYLFITFGTAWTYFLEENKEVASNCHKFPAKDFTRKLIDVDFIVSEMELILGKLLAQNKNLKTIFTVSPVRHWKDGANGNQISKATLLLAIEKLKKKYTSVSYFPSYELVIDDLRDYRFYAEDMLHPNDLAVKYIFEKFAKCYFNSSTQETNKEIEQINRGLAHRPFNPNSENHQKFLKKLSEKIEKLKIENNIKL